MISVIEWLWKFDIIGLVAGAVIAFFVLKNNPKFLNVEKISATKLLELKAKIEAQIAKIKEKI